jgi:hypothetical protein
MVILCTVRMNLTIATGERSQRYHCTGQGLAATRTNNRINGVDLIDVPGMM